MPDPIRITVTQQGELIRVKVYPPPRIMVKVFTAGAQGVPGPPGNPWHINQVLTGTINGSNDTFLAPSDFDPDTVEVLLNGQMLDNPDDFHTTGLRTVIITRTQAPIIGDKLRLNYQEN